MKCPICKDRSNISISNGDGYSQDVRECGSCGAVWAYVGDEIVLFE